MTIRTRRPYPSLKAWRAAHGLSQRAAAVKFGVKQAYWSKLELQRIRPRNQFALRLMAETNVPLEVIMGMAS